MAWINNMNKYGSAAIYAVNFTVVWTIKQPNMEVCTVIYAVNELSHG